MYKLEKIPLTNIDRVDIVTTKRMTGDQVRKKYGGDYIINLTLYDMASGENITYLEDENKKSGYLFSSEGLGVKKDGTPVWCSKDKAYDSDDIKDYCSFSPVLVKDGKVSVDWGNKVSSYVNGKHNRCFCGINGTHLFLGICNTNISIDTLARYCASQGMKYAGNNDGNGSIYMYANGKTVRNSSRTNATWLIVYTKKVVQKPTTNKEEEKVNITKTKLDLCGEIKQVDTINIDGTNYIKLRDLESPRIDVDYDAERKIPVIRVI